MQNSRCQPQQGSGKEQGQNQVIHAYLQISATEKHRPKKLKKETMKGLMLTPVGFEPTPSRTGA